MITLTGKKVSEGIAIGKISIFRRELKEVRRFYIRDPQKEISRFSKAREKAVLELEELYETSVREVGEANAAIFEYQQEILNNQDLIDAVNNIILNEKLNAEYAMRNAAMDLLQNGMDKNHEVDIQDASTRVIRILSRSWKDRMFVDEPFVMMANDLYPSEIVQLDVSKVLGIITKQGTINSHTSVLARTRGIPTVVGLGEVLKDEYEGKTIIVDGYDGKIYIEPDYSFVQKMKERQDAHSFRTRNLERLKGKENVTQSGLRIDVSANVGSREDIEQVIRSDAGGIGLFRSEFLYMESQPKLPSEQLQFETYKLAAESMGMNHVVIRTADLGGDKRISIIDNSKENNPAMGMRGIRISKEKTEIFKSQLRAVLRASAYGNLRVMFPMVTSVEEVQWAKLQLEIAKQELREEKVPFEERLEVGAMIETPAAVMLSGELAKEVDFLSIGTNDLTQFTLGMDRTNENLDKYFNPHHPALLKMIRIVTNNAHLEEKEVCICGDLAADLSLTEYFVGVGVDELSVPAQQVLSLRKKIRELK